MEMGKKRDYFSYYSNSSKEENLLHQKHESFTFELPLTELTGKVQGNKNSCNIEKVYFQ